MTRHPRSSYLICATPRSGSTLLCEALTNTDIAGHPKEYFETLYATGLPRRPFEYFEDSQLSDVVEHLGGKAHTGTAIALQASAPPYADYLAAVLEEGTTPNGVFGAKVMWGYLPDLVSNLHTIPEYRHLDTPALLATIFPRLHYIRVIRRDKVRQAISLWKALQTQTGAKTMTRRQTMFLVKGGSYAFTLQPLSILYSKFRGRSRRGGITSSKSLCNPW